MPNLIVNVTFNPPEVRMMGTTLREETVHKLEALLPAATTTSSPLGQNRREPPKFQQHNNPQHWYINLGQHYCDQLGRSIIFMCLIEALEGEDWALKGTNTVTHPDSGKDTTKFFFYRA